MFLYLLSVLKVFGIFNRKVERRIISMVKHRRKKNGITSVVSDVVSITSGLSWWGALLVGITSYILISFVLVGYIEGIIASQASSHIHLLTAVRLSHLVLVCNWVGFACLFVGLFFAVRNYFVSKHANRNERSIVTILAKLLGRDFD